MPELDIVQVDAFTTTRYGGNPCAVVFDADDLSSEDMQKIAQEMNLSETAFVLNAEKADVRARYFTPSEEIPLAGHPTISTIYALIRSGRLAMSGAEKTIRLQLEAGIITVDVNRDDAGLLITMSQLPPKFMAKHSPEDVAPAFSLSPDDILPDAPPQTVSTGTPQLMIAVKSLESLKKAQLDIVAYGELRERCDFFSPHLFVVQGLTERGATFARHFGLPPDTIEDPFTGSATGGMAAFLWHHGLIKEKSFIAEQGHWMGRPGEAQVEVVTAGEEITTVKVAGRAVDIFHGKINTP